MLCCSRQRVVGLVILVTSCMLFSASANSHAQSRSNSEDLALLFCSYVQANDSNRFRNLLRNMRLRIRDLYPRIRCNNYSLIQFAAVSNSYDIGRFIAHSVRVDDLHQTGDLQWVDSLEPTHPIAEVILERSDTDSYEP